MGRPIIQYPQDIFAMHELIWSIQPDLIIETGIRLIQPGISLTALTVAARNGRIASLTTVARQRIVL
jgi:cephalosporin hydroxylase